MKLTKEQEMAKRNLIFKAMVGSKLYGTDTKKSDRDYVGIFIPDKEYILGLKRCEQVEFRTNPSSSGHRNSKDDIDMTLYSLPKFIKLASENNPNIVELFFIDDKHIMECTSYGKRLIESFPFFISKKAKHKFSGYAHSQRQKILNRVPIGGRKEYTEKFGFDVKFASHLIRLLVEGNELLMNGKLEFPIPQNRYIRDIKEGKFSLKQIFAKADQLESLSEELYVKSDLRHSPDLEAINDLQIELLEEFWKEQIANHFYEATKRQGW